ncbi:uncharacterized protein VTP21DRAFT_2867 [Calcarisporiella thermophila]|uniref:uncharacterized protein n=1 Tax=Calcarisporiella thermophila TaxID=911321 RepID=UPI0037448730
MTSATARSPVSLWRQSRQQHPEVRAYTRTVLHNPVIRQVALCALRSPVAKDVIFSKETSLELLELQENFTLSSLLEQPTFGIVKDMRVLHCFFNDDRVAGELSQKCTTIPGEDVLVFLSDSGMLSFVTWKPPEDGNKGRFIAAAQHPISRPGFHFKDTQRLLCIDPLSRVIAAAPFQDSVTIITLNTLTRENFDPVKEVKHIAFEGVVLDMAFLFPSDGQEEFAYLVMAFAGDVDKSMNISIYQIATSKILEHSNLYANMTLYHGGPILLRVIAIPEYPENFLVFSETEAMLLRVSQVVSAVTDYPRCVVLSSDNDAILTAFTSIQSSNGSQYLYASSDEGTIFKISPSLDCGIQVCRVDDIFPVGPTMALLSSSEEFGDILAVTGEMCDGAVISVLGSQKISQLQTIANWSPVVDFRLVDTYHSKFNTAYLCSGRGRYGAIREVRFGIGIETTATTAAEFNGITGIWNLKNRPEDSNDTFLVLSFVRETRLMDLGTGELEDITDTSGFDMNMSTIYASTLPEAPGYLMQVHNDAIVITQPRRKENLDDIKEQEVIRWTPPFEWNIVLATSGGMRVFLCLAKGYKNTLCIYTVTLDGHREALSLEVSKKLQDEPSCISWCPSDDEFYHTFILLGNHAPSVDIFALGKTGYLTPHKRIVLNDYALRLINVPHSVFLTCRDDHRQSYLVIGLREGSVVYFDVDWEEYGMPTYTNPVIRRVGTLPVRLIPGERGEFLALSDLEWKVSLGWTSLEFSRILLDNPQQITMATPFSYNDSISTYMIITDDGRLHFASLRERPRYKMRTIPLNEMPRRLVYDEKSGNLVVACLGREAMIKVVDPKRGKILHEKNLFEEEIYCMIGWKLKSDHGCKEIIVVGTGVRTFFDFNVPPSLGLCHLFELEENEQKEVRLTEICHNDFHEGAVHAVCPLMDDYLLISSGKILNIYQFNFENNTLTLIHRKILRCLITSLSTYGNRICVGTQKDSLLLFSFSSTPVAPSSAHAANITPTSTTTLTFLKSEANSRMIDDSLMLSDSLVIASDKMGGVFGMGCPVDGRRERGDDESRERTTNSGWNGGGVSKSVGPYFSVGRGEVVPRFRVGSLVFPHWNNTMRLDLGEDDYEKARKEITLSWHQGWDGKGEKEGGKVDDQGESVVGCTVLGGLQVWLRLNQHAYEILVLLQRALERHSGTSLLLSNQHSRPARHSFSHAINGDFVTSFLYLSAREQEEVLLRYPDLVARVVEPDAWGLLLGNENRDILFGISEVGRRVRAIAKGLCALLEKLEGKCV